MAYERDHVAGSDQRGGVGGGQERGGSAGKTLLARRKVSGPETIVGQPGEGAAFIPQPTPAAAPAPAPTAQTITGPDAAALTAPLAMPQAASVDAGINSLFTPTRRRRQRAALHPANAYGFA